MDRFMSWAVLSIMVVTLGAYVTVQEPSLSLISHARPYLGQQLHTLLGTFVRECRSGCVPELAEGGLASRLACLTLLGCGLAAAWSVADRCSGSRAEQPLVFGIVGTALVVVPAAVLGGLASMSGTHLLRPPAGPLVCATPALATLVMALRRGWRPAGPRRVSWPPGIVVPLIAVLAVSLLLTSLTVGLMYPPSGYDALAVFAPMGIFIWRDGDLTTFLARSPEYWPLAHPGAAQVWFGLLAMLGGERLADLGQFPFACLGGAGVGALARRLGLPPGASALAAVSFLITPVVVAQSRMQLDDVVGGALLIATAALAAAPRAQWQWSRMVLVGLGLGLVVTTRLSQLPAAVAIGLFVAAALVTVRSRSGHASTAARQLSALLGAFAVVVAAWWIRDMLLFGNPLYPASLPLIGHGISQTNFVPKDDEFIPTLGPWAWALYPFLERHNEVSGFGTLLVVAGLPGLAIALVRAPRQPVLMCSLAILTMLPTWWLFSQHEPRFLVGIVGLTYACMPWVLVGVPRNRRRWALALIGAAAAFSAVVTFNGALLVNVFEPNRREIYYDHDWAVDPSVAALPSTESLLLNTGYSWVDYATFYPLLGPTLSRTVLVVDGGGAEDIAVIMRSARVRYAYVVASESNQLLIEKKYGPPFRLVQISSAEIRHEPLQRYLYELP